MRGGDGDYLIVQLTRHACEANPCTVVARALQCQQVAPPAVLWVWHVAVADAHATFVAKLADGGGLAQEVARCVLGELGIHEVIQVHTGLRAQCVCQAQQPQRLADDVSCHHGVTMVVCGGRNGGKEGREGGLVARGAGVGARRADALAPSGARPSAGSGVVLGDV